MSHLGASKTGLSSVYFAFILTHMRLYHLYTELMAKFGLRAFIVCPICYQSTTRFLEERTRKSDLHWLDP